MKILTVDDSKAIRKVVGDAILKLGYGVIEADCGTKALKILSEEPDNIELVILDWNMPGLSGIEVLEIIKSDEKLKELPVLMVTTETEMDSIISAVQLGVSNYLTKPFTNDDLEDMIKACIGLG